MVNISLVKGRPKQGAMKRTLSILGVIGVTALITYLAITQQLTQERADRLDRALAEAEARVSQLEADIEAANLRLTEMAQARQVSRGPTPPSRPAPAAVRTAPETPPAPSLMAEPGVTEAVPATGPGTAITVAAPPVIGPLVRYATFTRSGLTNLVRIEGTSNFRDWQVEGRVISGNAELGAGLPTRARVQVDPGPVDAKLKVFIPVRSLKSVEKDGRPYSDRMDEALYSKLLEPTYKGITYTLTSLKLQEKAREMTEPYLYEATGELGLAGVTNIVTMPVTVSVDPNGWMRFAGSVKLKMTDFNISPPVQNTVMGKIVAGDEVTLRFAWWLNRVNTGQAAR
jgi:polyisoprenoid-binding protein YceI